MKRNRRYQLAGLVRFVPKSTKKKKELHFLWSPKLIWQGLKLLQKKYTKYNINANNFYLYTYLY